MITKSVLNAILHHVGISWTICSTKEMKNVIDKSNHQNLLIKVPRYKTAICSRFHGSLFEYFITHAKTDRYNFICSLVAHDINKIFL